MILSQCLVKSNLAFLTCLQDAESKVKDREAVGLGPVLQKSAEASEGRTGPHHRPLHNSNMVLKVTRTLPVLALSLSLLVNAVLAQPPL